MDGLARRLNDEGLRGFLKHCRRKEVRSKGRYGWVGTGSSRDPRPISEATTLIDTRRTAPKIAGVRMTGPSSATEPHLLLQETHAGHYSVPDVGNSQNAIGMAIVLCSSIPVGMGWSMVSMIGNRVPSLQTSCFRFFAQGVMTLLAIATTRGERCQLKTWIGSRDKLHLFLSEDYAAAPR